MRSITAAGGGQAALRTFRRRLPSWSGALAVLQRIGRSLMLPIAVLPAGALLLRLGQDDLLGHDGLGWDGIAEVVGGAGQALFTYLPLLFAVGVAIGFAKKSDGSTALAAVVGYLVFDRVTRTMFSHSADLQTSVMHRVVQDDGSVRQVIDWGEKNPTDVLGGIVIGVTAALLYQRFHRIKLPSWLAFFGGRRFVPIVTAGAALLLGVAFGAGWPVLGGWLTDFGNWVTGAGAAGAGVYGVVNRLLLPFGLHHIPNSLIWYIFGTYKGPDGVVHGEINRYLAGDPHAGGFVAGFFPVLMFGLPGAAMAIWRSAPPHRRKAVGGIMISAALTAFVTGVTEPIEFAFMFVAPVLFAVHVVLTGISMALMEGLGAQLGFGFSAGGIDLLLNATKDNTRGLPWVIGLGLVYFVVYYSVFKFMIARFNLATPGREPEELEPGDATEPGLHKSSKDAAGIEQARPPGDGDRSGRAPGDGDQPRQAERAQDGGEQTGQAERAPDHEDQPRQAEPAPGDGEERQAERGSGDGKQARRGERARREGGKARHRERSDR